MPTKLREENALSLSDPLVLQRLLAVGQRIRVHNGSMLKRAERAK
jgi:hypothetical protein